VDGAEAYGVGNEAVAVAGRVKAENGERVADERDDTSRERVGSGDADTGSPKMARRLDEAP
jgi:hypothetical protein